MRSVRPFHPVIYHYLERYQKDPSSRIFAPLAEAYRKAGLLQEAIEIAREGLRFHPRFMGGRVALARALFDLTLYAQVVQELEPVIEDAPDNIAAQRLLAESNLMLGRRKEALHHYKMMLFYQSTDTEAKRMVEELETETLHLEPHSFFVPDEAPRTLGVFHAAKIRNIECLQALLPRIERYRLLRKTPMI